MGNKGGLEGVVVADSKLSLVDGENGRLIYAGYAIEELAETALFEEVAYLLWYDRLPKADELEELRLSIAKHAALPEGIITLLKGLPKDANPMAVLRTATSALAHYDADSEEIKNKNVALQKAIRVTGQMTTICAAWDRIRKGHEPIAPKHEYNLSENFVYMLTGEAPNADVAKAFNVYMVLLAEHGMNASTFTSRVVTATGGDFHSAVVAAIGALKGPAHGGANAEAMAQFVEIGEVENVEPWFIKNIKNGERRIMGIGHRIYKATDPRAQVLRDYSKRLAEATGNMKWFLIADNLAQLARADAYFIERKLYPNVDYFSAIMLYTLKLDIDMFTPLFAMSRIAGWSANIIEQMGGRLIRPDVNYTGVEDLKWVAIEQR